MLFFAVDCLKVRLDKFEADAAAIAQFTAVADEADLNLWH